METSNHANICMMEIPGDEKNDWTEKKKKFEKIDSQKLYIFDAKPSSTHQRSSAQETSSRKNSKRFILDIP